MWAPLARSHDPLLPLPCGAAGHAMIFGVAVLTKVESVCGQKKSR